MLTITVLAAEAAVLALAWVYSRLLGKTISFRVFNVRFEMYRV